MHDVVVIGGGPAGLQLVHRLAEGGYETLLLDDRREIGRRKICTGIIGAEAFEQLQLPRESVVNEIQQLRFVSPGGTTLDYVHPSLLAVVVNRSAFDLSLARRARESGVEILTEVRGRHVRVDDSGVSLQAVSVADSSQRFGLRARLLVIATGVNFRLNRILGLGAPDGFLNAVQTHVRVNELDCTHCFAGKRVAPGAFGWLVPLQRGWARLGLMTEGRSAPYFRNLIRRIAPYRMDPTEPAKAEFKPIAQRFNGRTFGKRVIAVGEAAGQVKTTTGGGIYYGLVGAEVAAAVLFDALKQDRLGEAHLSVYEDAWKDRMAAELAAGYSYRRTLSALSDSQIESLFRLARINGILPIVKRTARFDWHVPVLTSVARYGVIQKMLGIRLPAI